MPPSMTGMVNSGMSPKDAPEIVANMNPLRSFDICGCFLCPMENAWGTVATLRLLKGKIT